MQEAKKSPLLWLRQLIDVYKWCINYQNVTSIQRKALKYLFIQKFCYRAGVSQKYYALLMSSLGLSHWYISQVGRIPVE